MNPAAPKWGAMLALYGGNGRQECLPCQEGQVQEEEDSSLLVPRLRGDDTGRVKSGMTKEVKKAKADYKPDSVPGKGRRPFL